MTKIAVLMTCYNRKETTFQCLKKLFSLPVADLSIQVFLVDAGSADGTYEFIESNFPQVHLIKGPPSLYWNRGMDLAWRTAAEYDFDFYWWLNDDTMLQKDVLLKMYSAAKQTNFKAVIVGATASPSDLQKITYGGRQKKLRHPLVESSAKLQECDTFNGNCVLIPRYVYKIIGSLDLYFQHSWGDLDYGLRVKRKRLKNYVLTEPIGVCERHDQNCPWRDRKNKLTKRLQALYSPLGANPLEAFHFYKTHYSIWLAFLIMIKLHLNIFLVYPNHK